MKRLFTLAALCSIALFACEKTGNEPTEQTNENLVLAITAPTNQILEFPSAGGNGEIAFALTEEESSRSTAPNNVTATTSAEWITNIAVGKNKITFIVAQNADAERNDLITIKYKDQIKFVAVKQAGYERPDVTFTATHLNGTYWGKVEQKPGFNYQIILGDASSPIYSTKLDGSTEYRFNIYSDVSSMFNKRHSVPVGTYKIDHSSSGRVGTINGHKDESYYLGPNFEDKPYGDATMVVTENSIIVDVTFFDGKKHHIEYHGDLHFEGYTEGTYEDIPTWSSYTNDITFDVTGGSVNGYFRGDYFLTGCDVWFIDMIEQKYPRYNGLYLLLDLIVPKSEDGLNNIDLLEGEYNIISAEPESYEYTAPAGRFRADGLQWHAWYSQCEDSQNITSLAAPIKSGTIKVTVDGYTLTFEIDGTDDAGNKIIGTFTGTLDAIYDQNYLK